MKRTLLLLALLSFCFAAASPASVSAGLEQLCASTKSLFGILIMLLFILSIIPLGLGAFLYFFKKESKNLRLAGLVLLVIGALCLAGSIISLLIYILIPVYVSSLVGDASNVRC